MNRQLDIYRLQYDMYHMIEPLSDGSFLLKIVKLGNQGFTLAKLIPEYEQGIHEAVIAMEELVTELKLTPIKK